MSLLKLWFTRDWEAKLVAFVLAFLLWYVIKDQINRASLKQDAPKGWRLETEKK